MAFEVNTPVEDYEDPLTAESLEETARKFFEEISPTDEASDSDDSDDEDEDVSSLDDPSDDDDPDDGGSDASSPSDPPSSDLQDLIDLQEHGKISKQEVLALAQFQQFLKSRPDIQVGLRDLIQGKANIVPENKPNYGDVQEKNYSKERVPENLDLDDPSIKMLWDEAQELRRAYAEMQAQLGTHNQVITAQQEQNSRAFVVQAETDFAKEHNLSADDIVKIKEVAGRLGVLPTLLSPIDPITGLPREVNPIDALKKTFSTAYNMMPEFETRRQAKLAEKAKADRQRKKKLSSLSGSSGSVPRATTHKEPTNAYERRQAMVREVANTMFGAGKE